MLIRNPQILWVLSLVCSRRTGNSFERANVVVLELRLPSVANDKAFSSCPLASRNAGGTVTPKRGYLNG
jgi:hypothetical protein